MQKSLATLIVAAAFASPLIAQDAEELANLSRSDFLEEYETRFVDSMLVQQELMGRVSPEFRDNLDVGPVTDEERAGFACVYDALAAQDQVIQLTEQMLAYEVMRDRMEADPTFDMVSMMFDEEFMESFSNEVPDEAFAAMSDCDLISLSSSRMDFTPELWATLGQAAQERGYVDD